LLNVPLGEGVNLGLNKMAEASNTHDYFQLSRLPGNAWLGSGGRAIPHPAKASSAVVAFLDIRLLAISISVL